MKLQNILVATDLSPAAEPVYRWAVALARRFGSRVTLLNVDETNEFQWPTRTLQGSVRLKLFLEELSPAPVRQHHRERGEALHGAGARLPGALPRAALRFGIQGLLRDNRRS